MKRISLILLLAVALLTATRASAAYSYDTVPGDPMKARIYTLPNGLKVYLSENHLTPRIQTYVAVRVGGKNDPAETTGLSHYLEHLMFKGTSKFGTMDYAKERPMLDEIERLYEVYRHTTDSLKRKAIYHIIDSVSYEASKVAIPNEYDKLMSAIGATGTNAYTSYDQTVYVDNIPANQVENWARIQGERFSQLVVRGFHTELEAVYEEKTPRSPATAARCGRRCSARSSPTTPTASRPSSAPRTTSRTPPSPISAATSTTGTGPTIWPCAWPATSTAMR